MEIKDGIAFGSLATLPIGFALFVIIMSSYTSNHVVSLEMMGVYGLAIVGGVFLAIMALVCVLYCLQGISAE